MKKQQGIVLIGAIFILVIVALLGQYLVNIAGFQRQASVLTIQAARAYQTADAGIEWGLAQAMNGNCTQSSELSLPKNNFTTTVSCIKIGTYTENVTPVDVLLIQSRSQYGVFGDPDFVSRQLELKIQR